MSFQSGAGGLRYSSWLNLVLTIENESADTLVRGVVGLTLGDPDRRVPLVESEEVSFDPVYGLERSESQSFSGRIFISDVTPFVKRGRVRLPEGVEVDVVSKKFEFVELSFPELLHTMSEERRRAAQRLVKIIEGDSSLSVLESLLSTEQPSL